MPCRPYRAVRFFSPENQAEKKHEGLQTNQQAENRRLKDGKPRLYVEKERGGGQGTENGCGKDQQQGVGWLDAFLNLQAGDPKPKENPSAANQVA